MAFVARGFAPAAFGFAGVRLGGDDPPARLSLRTPGRERGRLPRMPSGFSRARSRALAPFAASSTS